MKAFFYKYVARDYLPRHCALDAITKYSLFSRAKEVLEEIICSAKNRKTLIKNIALSKSPGIEITQEHLCVLCTKEDCRLHSASQNQSKDGGNEECHSTLKKSMSW